MTEPNDADGLDLWNYSEDLGLWLNVSRSTLYDLMRSGKMPGEPAGDQRTRHRTSAVNRLLASSPHNFPQAPTLADLRSGRIALLKVPFVRDKLGYKASITVLNMIKSGELVGIKFIRDWRISQASLNALLAKRAQYDQIYLDRDIVVDITGYSPGSIISLVKAGVLRSEEQSGAPGQPIEIASLVVFLSTPGILCPGITPEEWIATRKAERERPVLLRRAAEALGVNLVILHRMLDDGEFEWIKSPGSGKGAKTFIPPSSIRARLATLPNLAEREIAAMLDTDVDELGALRYKGLLKCPLDKIHRHAASRMGFKSPCILALWKQGVRG
jgi:hypothetical protein